MLALFLNDIKFNFRQGSVSLTLIFFLSIVLIFPFSFGSDPELLKRTGSVIIWVSILLACLSSLERLFRIDKEDGSLDSMAACRESSFLPFLVFVKCFAFWFSNIFPLVLLSPFLGFLFLMDRVEIVSLSLSLLVGTPALVFAGSIAAAAVASVPRCNFLIFVLIFPLVIPVLIFGLLASRSFLSFASHSVFFPFFFLAGLTCFFCFFGSFFAGFILSSPDD